MTNNPSNLSDCQQLESALSALLDGELHGTEKSALAAHLIQCDDCRQRVRTFEEVNRWVMRRGEAPVAVHRPVSRWRAYWRIAPALAAAAMLLIGALVYWPNPHSIEAEPLTAEEMLRPIRQAQLIVDRREMDQALMLRTLELNLRKMQLEVDAMPPEDPLRASMQDRIDRLSWRVLESQFTFAVSDL